MRTVLTDVEDHILASIPRAYFGDPQQLVNLYHAINDVQKGTWRRYHELEDDFIITFLGFPIFDLRPRVVAFLERIVGKEGPKKYAND